MALGLLILWFPICFLAVALLRINYPFELEWMEGGVLNHIHRIQQRQPIYTAPTLDFIPFIYPPFYYCVAAVLPGAGFLPLRILSFAATLGILGVIYSWVKRETGSYKFAALSAAFYCATYASTGSWFDTARVDSLFLFFALSALFLLRFGTTVGALALAGIVMAAAFLTKTTMLIAGLPLIAWVIAVHRGKSIAFLGPTLVIGLGGLVVFQRAFGDWLMYYVFDLPARHEIAWPMAWKFWVQDIGLRVGIAALFTGYYVVRGIRKELSARTGFYVCAALGMIGSAYFSRLHVGGYANVLMPADAMLAVFLGLAAHNLTKSPPEFLNGHARTIVTLLCLAQFCILLYTPRPLIPTAGDAAKGRQLVKEIAAMKGDVYIPCHGYLAEMAGKRNCAHGVAFYDVWRAYHGSERQEMISRILAPLKARRFGALVTDSAWNVKQVQDWIELGYVFDSKLFADDNAFRTVCGLRTRPDMLYKPKAK